MSNANMAADRQAFAYRNNACRLPADGRADVGAAADRQAFAYRNNACRLPADGRADAGAASVEKFHFNPKVPRLAGFDKLQGALPAEVRAAFQLIGARGLRGPGDRGKDRRHSVRPGEQGPLSGHLPGDADGGGGVY